MIQPYKGLWEVPAEGILLFDSYAKTASPLVENFEFELKTREERLFQLSPIIKGWSVVGRADKYLSAGAVEIIEITTDEIVLSMEELGVLTLWTKNGVPKLNGVPFKHLGGDLYELNIKKISKQKKNRIRL